MQFLRLYRLIIAFLFAGLMISLSACQKSANSSGTPGSPAPTSSPTPVHTEAGGGIDGSGGDVIQSSLEEVKQAIGVEMAALPTRLQRMAYGLSADESIYDYQYGRGAKKIIQSFLMIKLPNQKIPLLENLQTGDIQILPQEEPCRSKVGNHAGSATGNFTKGEICISNKSLQTMPPQVLNEEIFKLLIHELSHLAGFNEKKATEIQKLLTFHRSIYSEVYESGFINGLKGCDQNHIEQEIKMMESSQYWQDQKKKLVDLLSGSQPRGCDTMSNAITDKVDIFSDDAEFIQVTSKFPRSGYRFFERTNQKSEVKAHLSWEWVQDITVLASIQVTTPTRHLTGIKGRLGTDAQCSPKILLANLIANIPDIFELRCGYGSKQVNSFERMKIRIAKEKEILNNEPKQ